MTKRCLLEPCFLSKDGITIEEGLAALGLAKVYKRYASQCDWVKQT